MIFIESMMIVSVMPEQREIIGQRFKVQYIDNRGEWRDFGPILSLTEDGALGYFREFDYALKKNCESHRGSNQVRSGLSSSEELMTY
jgi:hypothetical protein